MKRALFLITLACMVIVYSCDDKRAGRNNEAGIAGFLLAYYDAMSSRQWDRYKTFFWDSATLTTAWQAPGENKPKVAIVTIDEFIRRAPEGPDSQPIFEEKMTGEPEIKVSGNIATVWAMYKARFGREGNLKQWQGTDIFTLMKHQGQWKIVSLVYE